jgi:hypothetical protein
LDRNARQHVLTEEAAGTRRRQSAIGLLAGDVAHDF